MAPDATDKLEYLGPTPSPESALGVLAAPVRHWFQLRMGQPTPAQCLAWPALTAGNHLLLSAPTGSGKTLAAFLPILSELLTQPASGGIRCLYLAPLKALAADCRKNLRRCLAGIASLCSEPAVRVRIGLRTGDTSERVRRRLCLQPPDVLLTTPESLAVLLSQPASIDWFRELRWVVVDEVHALAANKRGADLSLSLERLTQLSGGSLQRIGLSATCAPVADVARFVVGVGRRCSSAVVADAAPLELAIEPLEAAGHGFLRQLLDRLEPELTTNRTTLIFTNARGLAERVTWGLRRRLPQWAEEIAAHHSSLAAARRRVVERRLKQGRLRAVVSSTSLELGIDIGSVDRVVLVHPPGAVVRLLQRVGRSGHSPGQTRRGLVLTATPAELLEAAVTSASGHLSQYEPLRIPAGPLDVLCQQILGVAAQQACLPDDVLELAHRAYPYRNLSRRDLDDCLDYLSGRHRDGRSWLPPRLRWHGDAFAILDQRTARLVRRNIGTIIAEEPRTVRQTGVRGQRPEVRDGGDAAFLTSDLCPVTSAPVGQVDEAFADRLRPGDRFLLDGRCLEVRGSDGRAVLVEEAVGHPAVPRWAGSLGPLSADLARRLYVLRTQAAEALRDGPEALAHLLHEHYGLNGPAIAMLITHFQRQECISEIPDPTACLVEAVRGGFSTDYYVHTPLNRAGNDTLARVAVLRLARGRRQTVTSAVADLGFMLSLGSGPDLTPAELRTLLAAEDFAADLTRALDDSITLRERFRCVALTGLMILRNPLGQRRRVGGRDWPERRLFEQVRQSDPDFLFLRQAMNEVRTETLDLPAALAFLVDWPRLSIHWRWLPQVSPFAESWTQLAMGPMDGLESPLDALKRLQAMLLGESPNGDTSPRC
jgi:ATP-dependent Lhr-like helicase